MDERHEISKNMLKYGIDLETIVNMTGLTKAAGERMKTNL